jgi:hypothetical protein
MRKPKIHLFGKHSNRTPLSYKSYKPLFQAHFEFVEEAEDADILVTGFNVDFRENSSRLSKLIEKRPSIKLAVLSEEPLWDTLWSGNINDEIGSINYQIEDRQVALKYAIHNHITSSIFQFEKIPYFITTDDNYYLRYNMLYARNSKLNASQLIDLWKNAATRRAFFAAKRIGDKFRYQNDVLDITGLNSYRSQIANFFRDEKTLLEGHGWQDGPPRQSLTDWHLDKLGKIDSKSFIVSGLENTHLKSYVSEKIFDSYAALAIPIYYASPDHFAFKVTGPPSFINVYNKSAEDAIHLIQSFAPTPAFLDMYRETQSHLNQTFRTPNLYLSERNRVVKETVAAFTKII